MLLPRDRLLLAAAMLMACVGGPDHELSGHGEEAEPTALQAALDEVAALSRTRSPGSELAIAVQRLDDGGATSASLDGDAMHVSASSAKAIWVAAALHGGVPVEVLEPYAALIFPSSDNVAAGRVIDRLGQYRGGGATEGADAINDFMWSLGMSRSAFQSWSGFPAGVVRHASNAPHALGAYNWDNYFTASDAVRFLAAVDRGEVLGPSETDALRSWMTWSPDTGLGGWLGARLPPAARETMMHKAGWLPPEWYPTLGSLNELGIVQVPDGPRYAVAIFARQRAGDVGIAWWRHAALVELASCVVYEAIADVDLGCVEPATGGSPTPSGGGGSTVYCTNPGWGCGGHSPCWPATDCPGGTTCDWADDDWGSCR